jgi:hypothetical protein
MREHHALKQDGVRELLFVLMLQSFETTGPPPPGHSGEFNTDQVLKNINSPAPEANCSVKTLVQLSFSIPKL